PGEPKGPPRCASRTLSRVAFPACRGPFTTTPRNASTRSRSAASACRGTKPGTSSIHLALLDPLLGSADDPPTQWLTIRREDHQQSAEQPTRTSLGLLTRYRRSHRSLDRSGLARHCPTDHATSADRERQRV